MWRKDCHQINEGIIDLERATALATNPRDKADVIGLKGTAYARKAMKEKCRTSALKALQYYEESLSIYPMPGVQADYENWKILSKALLKWKLILGIIYLLAQDVNNKGELF